VNLKGKKETLDMQAILEDDATLHAIDQGRYIIAQGDPGDPDTKFVRGESDLSSGTGAVRNGFAVLDLNKIEKRTWEIDDQLGKGLIERAVEGFPKVKTEVFDEFGKIKSDANLIFKSSPMESEE
jgi:hypothetical protein